MFPLRLLCPSMLDTTAYSCKTISLTALRCLSMSSGLHSKDNKNIKLNPLFENRNPRALEMMGYASKTKGWKYQAPRKDFYHKLVVQFKPVKCHIEHNSGKILLRANAKETAVRKHLYRDDDVSAAMNVGELMARRMLQAGLTDVFFDPAIEIASPKEAAQLDAFLQSLSDSHITFDEPEEVKFESVPGVNYEGYSRVDEKKAYQDDYQKL